MNIFVLDKDPVEAAKLCCDKHVIKMPTESMQMLSTNLNHFGIESPYKPVMLNHPCTIWARQSYENHEWLLEHCLALCKEYTARYGKVHAVESTFNQYWNELHQETLYAHWSTIGLTPFVRAIKKGVYTHLLDEKLFPCTIEAYREYYKLDKWRIATWRNGRPEWFPTPDQLFREKIYDN